MTKSLFSIDSLNGETFDGYTMGEEWNGWACPYFTFDQAEYIVKAYQRRGLAAKYDPEEDQFIFTDELGEEEAYSALEVEGRKFYPVGTANWIWEETTVGVAA